MKHYVLGFIFDQNKEKVLLIRKERPEWQAGYWNGIGGKIEMYSAKNGVVYESPLEAMKRECKEETNWNYNWKHCVTFVCSGGTVFVYKAISEYKSLERGGETIIFKQMEEEKLEIWRLDSLPDKMMKNLKWIIPVLLSTCQFPITICLNDIEKHTKKSDE